MKKIIFPATFFVCLSASAQTPVEAPYKQTFDTESTLNQFITIDANHDGECWDYNPMLHCAKCSWSEVGVGPVDDYLLLPIRLDAYAKYELTFNCYGAYFDDTFELLLADAPQVEGMRTQLIQPTDVRNISDNFVHRVTFSVETSGVYYIAWHDISAENQGTIFLDNVEVTCTPTTAPAAPEIVSAIPGEKGARECDLTFTMPTKTIAGDEVAEITEARIYRNDILVETLRKDAAGQPLQPGALCKWHDKELSNRLYTYKIVALTSDKEESAPCVKEVYVGIDSPGRVFNLTCREDINDPGKVILTWDAPEVGIHGGYLDPKGLSYVVSKSYNDEPTVFETRYEDRIDISGGQTYRAYSVYAQNAIGSNRSDWQTVSTHVGPAMMAPWGESYPGVSCKNGPWLTHVTGDTEIGDASWYISSPVGDIPDQDGDGGYTFFFTSRYGNSARYTSPKIDINSLSSPALSFWLYNKGNADVIEVGVMPEMTEWTTLKTITLDGEKGWHRYVVDLTPYLGSQFIQFGFNGISVEETSYITAVDNISIHDEAEYDIAVQKFDFPVRVDMGGKAKFTLNLRNRGTRPLAAGDYAVELYRRDADDAEPQLVSSVLGPALDTDAVKDVALYDEPGVFVPAEVKYSARVVLEGDADTANNNVDEQNTIVFRAVYPIPEGLTGVPDVDNLQLVWHPTELGEGTALPVTDSFEDYPIFSIDNCGDWTLYDADKQRTVIMAFTSGSDITVLDYENAGQPMAWQVFSSIDAGIPYTSWDAHSGELMMVAMGNSKNEADGTYHDNDDWLISPLLSGRAQSISFFAKCGMGSAYQPELLEVLYSSTDLDPSSFKPATSAPIELYNVSAWDEHVVDLPEGARYFALRCVSQHKFALLLDDVTYQPAGSADLSLLGYNVYCNRLKINDNPLPTATYCVDGLLPDVHYDFNVTAVYDKGESCPSETLSTIQNLPLGLHPAIIDTNAAAAFDLQGRHATSRSQGVLVNGHRKQIGK